MISALPPTLVAMAGVAQMILPLLKIVVLVQPRPAIVTVVPLAKPLPAIVIFVPPVVGPLFGAMPVTVGGTLGTLAV